MEHQEKAIYDCGNNLIFTRIKDEDVSDKTAGITDARTDHLHWYVPHYTPSIQQQGILSKQIQSKTPTEPRYIERFVFMKKINNQNLWNFELGSEESMNVPIGNIKGFQQRDRQDLHNLNNDTFFRLLVNSAQLITRTEN